MPFGLSDFLRRSPWRDAAIIALVYLTVATAWILLSDSAVAALAGSNVQLLDRLQSYKGLFFVGSTALLLFFGVGYALRARGRLEAEKRQVEQLLQAQSKFETLGQLAGSLAHDFNNVLTVIQSAASLAEAGHDSGEMLSTIQRSAKQAERSIASLMLFARQQPAAFVRFDLPAHLAEILALIRQALGKRVVLQSSLPDSPLMVRGVPALLTQTLLNLATNARDAIADRPEPWCSLSMTTRTLAGYRSLFRPRPADGLHAVISFSDNGCGIAPENFAAIFAPLYTTKPAGKGTGLGLSSALYAVQQHDGWIEVESRVGMGTTFRVFIPAVA